MPANSLFTRPTFRLIAVLLLLLLLLFALTDTAYTWRGSQLCVLRSVEGWRVESNRKRAGVCITRILCIIDYYIYAPTRTSLCD